MNPNAILFPFATEQFQAQIFKRLLHFKFRFQDARQHQGSAAIQLRHDPPAFRDEQVGNQVRANQIIFAAGRSGSFATSPRAIFNFLATRFTRALAARRGPIQDQNQRREPADSRVWPPQSPEFPNRCRCPKTISWCSGALWASTVGGQRTAATIWCRQNEVVACWPVPKLKPGSRMTTAWFLRGLRLIQLGLTSSALPISIALKCRFHDSAQSSRRTFAILILPEPMFRPQFLIRFNPAEIFSGLPRAKIIRAEQKR